MLKRRKRTSKVLIGVGKLVKPCYNSVGSLIKSCIGSSTAVKTMESINEAVGPFLPLVAIITALTKEISDAYENVQYNKKTCGILINRIEAAEASIKGLMRLKEENIQQFLNQNYYKSFRRF